MDDLRFTAVAVVVAAVAPFLAIVGVLVLPAPTAFTGSISASALVTLVFAVQNASQVRAAGLPSFPAGGVATVLGCWLAVAPVVYDAGCAPTALVQFMGLLTASFSGYTVLETADRLVMAEPNDRL